jgi:hypothetical protein
MHLDDKKHGASIFTLPVFHVEFILLVEHCDYLFGPTLAIMKFSLSGIVSIILSLVG